MTMKKIISILLLGALFLPLAAIHAEDTTAAETITIGPILKHSAPSDTIDPRDMIVMRTVSGKAVVQKTIPQSSFLEALSEGALLRDTATKRVYRVANGQLVHIKTLAELRLFSGRTITNVDFDALAWYESI